LKSFFGLPGKDWLIDLNVLATCSGELLDLFIENGCKIGCKFGI